MADSTMNNTGGADQATEVTASPKSSFVPFAGGLVLGVIVGALAGAFFAPLVESKMGTQPSKAPAGLNKSVTIPGVSDNPETLARRSEEAKRAAETAGKSEMPGMVPSPTPSPAPSPTTPTTPAPTKP